MERGSRVPGGRFVNGRKQEQKEQVRQRAGRAAREQKSGRYDQGARSVSDGMVKSGFRDSWLFEVLEVVVSLLT